MLIIVKKTLWAVGAPPWTPLGSSQRSPDLLAGGEGACYPPQENSSPLLALGLDLRPFGPGEGLLPPPRTPPLLSAFGLHLRPFGPHSATSPVFTPNFRGLDKTQWGLTTKLLYSEKSIFVPMGIVTPHTPPHRGLWPIQYPPLLQVWNLPTPMNSDGTFLCMCFFIYF